MRILYINHYAGAPKYGMEYRPYYLSKEWIRQGHNVIIVGSSFSHLRTTQPRVSKSVESEIIDGIHYIWIKCPKYSSSGILRIINILSFVLKLFIYKKKIVNFSKPDVVIASSTYPLDIFPAHAISNISHAKLVFELHDMWPLTPIVIGGYSKYHPFILLMQYAEIYSCKHSNGYISLLGNAENYLLEHGLAKGKFVHIPNGFIEEEWNNVESILPVEFHSLFIKLRTMNQIIIGYAGGHGPSNALETLINSSPQLEKMNCSIVLIGNGVCKEFLIKKVNGNKLKNVYFLPPVNKNQIPSLINYFDIAYAGGVKSFLHSFGTSFNKLTDYMLAAKPIVYSVDESNSIVEKAQCGVQIPAENVNLLADAIRKLVQMSDSERRALGHNGKNYAIENLSYAQLAQKAINAFEKF